MDWRKKYSDKIVNAEEAVSHIKSGDKIIFGDWIGEPPALVEALMARSDELRDVKIIHGMSPGPNEYVEPQYKENFHHISLFIGPKTRKAYLESRMDYIGGTPFHKWPRIFAENPDVNPHWAFIQVSLPDENGYCSYGNSCCFTEPAARTAERVIAQVNENMPTLGGKKFDLADASFIVEANTPIYTIGKVEIDEKLQIIANYVCTLVEDRVTIQLGIGALPDAIARNLMDKKDLGVHSETLTESMMDLVKAGVITNKYKKLNEGLCVGAQAAGTEEFYKFLDHNPMFEIQPVDYVNDPYIIGQNYKMTSINACLEVDLQGQVNSETVGGRQYSGIGGQLDHVRGSQLSEGGKSILTLKSTAKNDTITKIVPNFEPGAITTISRYDVDYIVTEYGIAHLRFKTVRQRAEALIKIAHPKFREELTAKAKDMGFIPKD